MRTVVTGGAGFIGSHLTEHLLASGDRSPCSTTSHRQPGQSRRPGRPPERFELGARARCWTGELVDGSSTARTGCSTWPPRSGCAGSSRSRCRACGSTCTAPRTCWRPRCAAGATVLLASTSEIYGKNTADALHEDSDRILGSPLVAAGPTPRPRASTRPSRMPTGASTACTVAIVRLFNTVGPRQTGRYGMVVPNLVGQALRGEPLTVFGDGTQTRCFSYVGDIVPALVGLVEHPASPRAGVQPGRGDRDLDLRPGPPHHRAAGQPERDRAGALLPGLRRGLRGHASSGAGQHQGQGSSASPRAPGSTRSSSW